jgi:hypothetical protein
MKVKTAGGADAGEGGHGESEGDGVLEAHQLAVELADEGGLVEAGIGALLPGLEGDDEEAGIRAGGPVDEPVAGDGEEVVDARGGLDEGVDLVEDGLGALERGAVGELDIDDAVALVLLRHEAGGEAAEPEDGADGEADEEDDGEGGAADGEAGDAEVSRR